ncbi:hypothetical protein N9S51_00670 [Pelagibacteraceae bacterium]|jgi:hypothetical protein|nr:hypothetical protein [Pelagibacteraceae bacterium]
MTDIILEAGGTLAFTFHVLFMLFNAFVVYQFFLNNKFYDQLGFSNEEPKTIFRGVLGVVFLAILLMSILLTFDVTGNTYEENVVQYKFWYSFLFILFAMATINGFLRFFNLVNNYGFKPTIRGLMFPLIGIILIIIRTIFEGY